MREPDVIGHVRVGQECDSSPLCVLICERAYFLVERRFRVSYGLNLGSRVGLDVAVPLLLQDIEREFAET